VQQAAPRGIRRNVGRYEKRRVTAARAAPGCYPMLRVRGDLRCAGEKHSYGECKKCALSQWSACKKFDYLVHFVRSKPVLRRKTNDASECPAKPTRLQQAFSRTTWPRQPATWQPVAVQMRQGSNALQVISKM